MYDVRTTYMVISPSHSKNMLVLVKIAMLQSRSFLSWNKNFMKIFVHLIWVCKHSDIKFESKNQFRKYVKNCPEIS